MTEYERAAKARADGREVTIDEVALTSVDQNGDRCVTLGHIARWVDEQTVGTAINRTPQEAHLHHDDDTERLAAVGGECSLDVFEGGHRLAIPRAHDFRAELGSG